MQASVPELTDLTQRAGSDLQAVRRRRQETRHVREHGACSRGGWSSAACASCRSITTTGTRTPTSPAACPINARTSIRPCYGLIQDLKQRGLLDETLVIWGGEFGRTIYSQGGLSAQNYGRDHHPRCFTMWMAGGGFKGGTVLGETDDFSYNIVKDPVHVRDFHATVLNQLGFDHERFTFKHQGLDQKLTGVLPARVRARNHFVTGVRRAAYHHRL